VKISNNIIEKMVLKVMNNGGWLVDMERKFGAEVALYAENYHSDLLQIFDDNEKYYREIEKPKVLKLIDEFRAENAEFALACQEARKEELENELVFLESELEKEVIGAESPEDLETIKKSDDWERASRLERQLHGNIDSSLIERARNYPLENLLEINRAGYAKCVSPDHDDKNPSMYCKNNYAYCFSCGFVGDTIKVLMSKEHITFPEAVRKLQ